MFQAQKPKPKKHQKQKTVWYFYQSPPRNQRTFESRSFQVTKDTLKELTRMQNQWTNSWSVQRSFLSLLALSASIRYSRSRQWLVALHSFLTYPTLYSRIEFLRLHASVRCDHVNSVQTNAASRERLAYLRDLRNNTFPRMLTVNSILWKYWVVT